MEKPELMKKLEAMIDEMAREQRWGKLEILFSKGEAHTIRKETTESLNQQGMGIPNRHASKLQR